MTLLYIIAMGEIRQWLPAVFTFIHNVLVFVATPSLQLKEHIYTKLRTDW